jgi:hypothetical protein
MGGVNWICFQVWEASELRRATGAGLSAPRIGLAPPRACDNGQHDRNYIVTPGGNKVAGPNHSRSKESRFGLRLQTSQLKK